MTYAPYEYALAVFQLYLILGMVTGAAVALGFLGLTNFKLGDASKLDPFARHTAMKLMVIMMVCWLPALLWQLAEPKDDDDDRRW